MTRDYQFMLACIITMIMGLDIKTSETVRAAILDVVVPWQSYKEWYQKWSISLLIYFVFCHFCHRFYLIDVHFWNITQNKYSIKHQEILT